MDGIRLIQLQKREEHRKREAERRKKRQEEAKRVAPPPVADSPSPATTATEWQEARDSDCCKAKC